MKFINYLLSTSILFIAGCGGNSSSTNGTNQDGSAKDPYRIQKVSYTLDGVNPPSCNKPSSISVSHDLGYSMIDCTWFCGEYEGAKPITVSLSFSKEENTAWALDSDYVTTAPSICHN